LSLKPDAVRNAALSLISSNDSSFEGGKLEFQG
jgi:hypothetical protein